MLSVCPRVLDRCTRRYFRSATTLYGLVSQAHAKGETVPLWCATLPARWRAGMPAC